MDLDERAASMTFLIRDRGANFTASFDAVFQAAGIRVLVTPIMAPPASAIAERWISSTRREATDQILITGKRHLPVVMAEYIEHHNTHRPHRALNQAPPDATSLPPHPPDDPTKIIRHQRLGGLINEYSQVA